MRDGAVDAVVKEVFSCFVFEGASRLPYFSFLDNKERIEKILEKGGIRRDSKDNLKRFQRFPFCKNGVAHFQ